MIYFSYSIAVLSLLYDIREYLTTRKIRFSSYFCLFRTALVASLLIASQTPNPLQKHIVVILVPISLLNLITTIILTRSNLFLIFSYVYAQRCSAIMHRKYHELPDAPTTIPIVEPDYTKFVSQIESVREIQNDNYRFSLLTDKKPKIRKDVII